MLKLNFEINMLIKYSQSQSKELGKSEKTKAADEAKKKKNAADKSKEEYIEKMRKKGATLPKGFIPDAKANTGH